VHCIICKLCQWSCYSKTFRNYVMYICICVYTHVIYIRTYGARTGYWWIYGSEMEYTDSLMKFLNRKRGREWKIVINPVAIQSNTSEECIPWESGKLYQLQTWICYLTSLFQSWVLFFICFSNVLNIWTLSSLSLWEVQTKHWLYDFLAVR